MKLTKILVIVLASLMVLSMAACTPAATTAATTTAGTTAATTTAATTTAASTVKEVKIGDYTFTVDTSIPISEREFGIVYMNTTVPFAQAINQGIVAAAKEFGVNAYMTGKDTWDTSAEIEVVENLIMKEVDGIAIAVMDEPGMTPVIQASLKDGIPTLTFNVDAIESGRLGFVGEDLFKAGAATAEDIVKRMGTKGKVLISSVAQSATWSRQRQDGVESVLSKYPDIEVVQIVDCPGSEQEAYGILENALLANPDINAHISLGGTCYMFGRVMKENNIGNMDSDKPIYSSGHDLTPNQEKLEQIRDGWISSAYSQNPYDQGYQAVKMLVDFYKTGDPASFKVLDTGVKCIDRTNVDEYFKMLEDGKPVG